MAQTRVTKSVNSSLKEIEYPYSDGKPLGESVVHVKVAALDLLDVIQRFYSGNLKVAAVHSNLFVYYVQGDPKRVVCPDLFVALDVPFDIKRLTYKVWEVGKSPDLAIEVTSKKTRREDQGQKLELYRDVLKVREYFMFDPFEEYLKPSLQGYRLSRGQYKPIASVRNRLPSEVLGLHLERDGYELRLYNPQTGLREPTSGELEEALRISEAKNRQDQKARRAAEAKSHEAEKATREAKDEIQRLRREIDSLRKNRNA